MESSSYPRASEALQSLGTERTFGRGDTVFFTGDPAQAVYCLLEGEVHLKRHGPDGAEVILHRVTKRGFFAEASLGTDHYHCTALCIRPSRILVLPRRRLQERLKNDPAFALEWVSLLSGQLRRQRATVERLQLRGAEERIRHYLLTEGSPPGEMHLQVNLTQWAAELALTRETVYRTLARMQARGSLQRNGDHLCLKGDPK